VARRPEPGAPLAGNPIVLVGVSTGGPGTLEEVLVGLPADFAAPIVIAQHMPANFTGVFARRLNDMCALEVLEVRAPQVLQPGRVYIGKGDADIVFTTRGGEPAVAVVPAAPNLLWHPSVDRMVESALKVIGPERLIGVQLTGMGYDGAEQFAQLHRLGGQTIAESEETAVVFGMPAELIKRGGAKVVLPCDKVGRQLIDWVARARRVAPRRT
jgi:two-component system chemotaxis response regulator CheB